MELKDLDQFKVSVVDSPFIEDRYDVWLGKKRVLEDVKPIEATSYMMKVQRKLNSVASAAQREIDYLQRKYQ